MFTLESLRDRVLSCRSCIDQSENEKTMTLPWGSVSNPRFMIIGESPSLNPLLPRVRNALLITPTGSILGDALTRIGVKSRENECYFTNIVKCAYGGKIGSIVICPKIWLQYEIDNVAPKAIITLGKVAQRAVKPLLIPPTVIPSTTKIYRLPHPAFTRKNPQARDKFWGIVATIIAEE